MKKIKLFITLLMIASSSHAYQAISDTSSDHIDAGYTLFVIFADDYEARSGKETSISTMRRGFGLDVGYHFEFLTHLRINPYFSYRYVRFTSMISALKADKAQVFGVATTLELDWSPKSSQNLMQDSWTYFFLYIFKFGAGVNVIRFSDPEKTWVPALSYSLGIGFPYRRFSIHVGGEGNLLFYKSKFSELDGYKLKIGYRF